MSAPGTPPETSDRGYGGLETPEEEDQLPLNARPTTALFDSNIAPQAPVTTDERFAPGTAPNTVGQITPPDELTPGRFAAPAPGQVAPELPPEASPTRQRYAAIPSTTQTDAGGGGQKLPLATTQKGPKSYTSLLSPVPVAKQEYTIRRRDDKFYKGQLDIEPEREQTRQIKGGVPSSRALKGTLSPNAQSWFEFAVAPREQGGLGLSAAGASGLVANLTVESFARVDPTAVGDNGASVGAAQWQKDRRTQLERLPNPRTTNTQQRHMHNELHGPYRAVYQRLLQAKTPEEAALVFGKGYEGYGDKSSTPIRVARAKQIFTMMSGGSATVAPTGKVSTSTVTEPVTGPNLTPEIPLDETAGPKVQARPFSLLSPTPAEDQVIPIGKPQGRLARSIATEPDTIANLKYKFQKAKDFVPTTSRIHTVPQQPQPFQVIQPPNAASVITAPTATSPTTGGQTGFVQQDQPLLQPKGPQDQSITITDENGKFVNIPTVVNGKKRTNAAAVKLYKAGKLSPVGGPFDTLDEATAAAKQRQEDFGQVLPQQVQQDVPVNITRRALPQDTGARSSSGLPYNKQAGPGPVYAPAGTPQDELDRLSQTRPWLSKYKNVRSWENYEPNRPITSAEPSKMLPRRPLDPEMKELIDIQRGIPTLNIGYEKHLQKMAQEQAALIDEEQAIANMNPTFDEPLYINPFSPEYVPPELRTSPTPETLATQPMPISPPEQAMIQTELSTPAPTVTRSENFTPVSPTGVSQAQFKFVAPQQDISVDEAGNPAMNPVQASQWKEDLMEVTRGVRWFGQGAVSSVAQFPYLFAAGLSSLEAMPYALITGAPAEHKQKEILERLRAAEQIEQTTKKWFGFDQNETAEGAEWVDKALGESIFPANKLRYILAGTSIMAGARGLIDPNSPFALTSSAEAAEVTVQDRKTGKQKREEKAAKKGEVQAGQDNRIQLPEVPGQIAQGNIVAGTIPGTAFGTVVPHPDEPGQVILVPNHNLYGKHALTPDQAIKQFGMTGLNFGTFKDAESANKYLEILNARVSQTVAAASGETQLRTQDIAVLGTMGALTLGMAAGPHLYRLFKHGRIPSGLPNNRGRMLDISEGPRHTYAFTSPKDYMRTMVDDFHAAKFSNLNKAGATPEEITKFENAFYGHTRGAATNVAQSAIVAGRAHTPEFNFELPAGVKSLSDLQRYDGGPTREYLYLWKTLDDINAVKAKPPAPAQGPTMPGGNPPLQPPATANVGPITVRGLDEAMVKNQIRAMEAGPDGQLLRGTRLDFQASKHETLRVTSQGQWATRTPEQARKIETERLNDINYGDEYFANTSPFNAQAVWVSRELRHLMENQANGQYVEFMKSRSPGMFREITKKQLDQNPHWDQNVIKLYEYGKPRYYATDPLLASTMKVDPHHFANPKWNTGMQWATASKRHFEITTTGWANPRFALINGPRNFFIQLLTARSHGLTPTYGGAALTAIPRSLIPQFTNGIAKSIDFGAIHQLLGPRMPAWVDALGKRWATTYPESLHAQLQAHGAHYGSAFDYKVASKNTLNNAILESSGKPRAFLTAFKNIISSVHDAAPTGVVSKNMWRTKLHPSDPRYVSMFEMARKKRALSGDPTIQGEAFGAEGRIRFHTSKPGPNASLMERGAARIDRGGAFVADKIGIAAEASRILVPWFNPITQGITSLAKAYWKNPATFTAGLWAAQGLPTGMAYMWNSSLGLDPQGQSYVLHQLQGRSPYNTMLNWYIGIPGRPAAEGREIPGKTPETSMVSRLVEITMDHLMRDPSQSWKEDFGKMVDQWLGIVGEIPMPPAAGILFGSMGISTTGGMLGDAFKRRDPPYDQHSGLPVNVEMAWRAAHGAAADMFTAGILAALQEEQTSQKPLRFLQEAGKQQLQNTAFLRNIFDMTPAATGNTSEIAEMYKYRGVFNKLDEFYRRYEYGGGMQLSNKPASKAGGALVEGHLGPPTPEIAPGPPQPATTNPLYNMYMQLVHQAITRDIPEKGGVGLKSAMKQFYKTNKELGTLRNVTSSNYGIWQLWINHEKNAPLKEFLQRHNVEWKNKTAVQNFYQLRRQNAGRVILGMFKDVENQVRQKSGDPKFNIKMLEPYLNMNDIADWTPKNTVLDIISGEYFGGAPASTGGMPAPGSMNPD